MLVVVLATPEIPEMPERVEGEAQVDRGGIFSNILSARLSHALVFQITLFLVFILAVAPVAPEG